MKNIIFCLVSTMLLLNNVLKNKLFRWHNYLGHHYQSGSENNSIESGHIIVDFVPDVHDPLKAVINFDG